MEQITQKPAFVHTLLKGVGQIMLQENSFTGLLFLIGIFYGSVPMGIGAILSVCCGTMTAKILKYNHDEIKQGLYGFSAALVGVALPFYFEPVIATWVAVVIGSALATIIQHFFIVKKIPVYTLPFILVTWLVLYIFHQVYPVPVSTLLTSHTSIGYNFAAAARGFGQVIFQGALFSGIVFFIGVFVNTPIAALYALAASVLGALLATCFSIPTDTIEMGLFGYNAVLCAIVFAGTDKMDGIWVFLATTFAVAIALFMSTYSLTQLTFPFVAATWITLTIKHFSLKYVVKPA
ncbi:urea transporter [Pedobacter nyackensis]|uniref:urea transporter n=1 Tax=Pedobacter nyackensis TaxID=475255 RepID=UPI002930C5CC|nr:urea transporter [Pedobacter nyackensis]